MATTFGNMDIVLASSASVIVPCLNGQQIVFMKASACNTDGSSHTVTIYRVAPAGSPGAANAIIDAETIAAGETAVLPLSGQTLTAGQSLQALASAGAFVRLNVGYAIQS